MTEHFSMLFLYFRNAYVNKIYWLYCSASLKVEEKLLNFKTNVQETTFQMKYQQQQQKNCNVVFIKTH